MNGRPCSGCSISQNSLLLYGYLVSFWPGCILGSTRPEKSTLRGSGGLWRGAKVGSGPKKGYSGRPHYAMVHPCRVFQELQNHSYLLPWPISIKIRLFVALPAAWGTYGGSKTPQKAPKCQKISQKGLLLAPYRAHTWHRGPKMFYAMSYTHRYHKSSDASNSCHAIAIVDASKT